MIKFSIIIVNYNQRDFLLACIDSVYSVFESCPFEIIILNNSPDEDLVLIPKQVRDDKCRQKNNLKIIQNSNTGFSRSNNLGAREAEGEYLFFLNADTIITNDFLRIFCERFDKDSFGAVGLRLSYPDGSFQLSAYRENNFVNEIKNKKAEKAFKKINNEIIPEIRGFYSREREVDWVSGAAFVMRKSVFEEIGGFDERFFLFYEDADICRRLRNKGHRVIFWTEADIIHYKGENVNKSFSSDTYFHSKESQLLYYKLHNNIIQNITLRVYLFLRFGVLTLVTFKNINFRILKLILGFKDDKST